MMRGLGEGAAARSLKSALSRTAATARDAASATAAHAGNAAHTVKDAGATLVAGIEGPPVPLLGPWRVGLGGLLREHPQLPGRVGPIVGLLDRLGYLEISAEAITFDHERVEWSAIEEIRLGPAADVLTAHALQHEIGRLTALLPRVPGRTWLVRRTIELLVAFCLAAAGRPGDREDGPGVPVGITYRRWVRRGELTPGVFVALVAASVPTVVPAIVETARAHGVAVTVAPPSRAHRQADAIRRAAAALTERLSRGHDTPDLDALEDDAEPAAIEPPDQRRPEDGS